MTARARKKDHASNVTEKCFRWNLYTNNCHLVLVQMSLSHLFSSFVPVAQRLIVDLTCDCQSKSCALQRGLMNISSIYTHMQCVQCKLEMLFNSLTVFTIIFHFILIFMSLNIANDTANGNVWTNNQQPQPLPTHILWPKRIMHQPTGVGFDRLLGFDQRTPNSTHHSMLQQT